MALNTKLEGNKLTIAPVGRLDTQTAPIFLEEAQPMLDNVDDLVLDYKDLEYSSSAGIRVLLVLLKTMEDKGGSLELCNVNENIRDVLDMTGMLSILTILDE